MSSAITPNLLVTQLNRNLPHGHPERPVYLSGWRKGMGKVWSRTLVDGRTNPVATTTALARSVWWRYSQEVSERE